MVHHAYSNAFKTDSKNSVGDSCRTKHHKAETIAESCSLDLLARLAGTGWTYATHPPSACLHGTCILLLSSESMTSSNSCGIPVVCMAVLASVPMMVVPCQPLFVKCLTRNPPPQPCGCKPEAKRTRRPRSRQEAQGLHASEHRLGHGLPRCLGEAPNRLLRGLPSRGGDARKWRLADAQGREVRSEQDDEPHQTWCATYVRHPRRELPIPLVS